MLNRHLSLLIEKIMLKTDRSLIYRNTLLHAIRQNKLGFQEKDILPLFIKYKKRQQTIVYALSFLAYIWRLPNFGYLYCARKSNLFFKKISHFRYWLSSMKFSHSSSIFRRHKISAQMNVIDEKLKPLS